MNLLEGKSYDCEKDDWVETPNSLLCFYKALKEICKEHNYSITHEDKLGSFEIVEYDEEYVNWIEQANINPCNESD